MNLCLAKFGIVGIPAGYKLLLLAKTIYCTLPCFIAVVCKEEPSAPIKGSTGSLHEQIPEATFLIFDTDGVQKHSASPYSAKKYLEHDAMRVVEFDRDGRVLRWIANGWCHFLGRRIDPEHVLVAL